MKTKLETRIEQAEIPGTAVVSVVRDSAPVTESAGVTNNESQQNVTEITVFEAASLSKPVFAYIVLKMVEQGELDLDKPLHSYYPAKKEDEPHNEKNGFGPPCPEIREHPNYQKLTAQKLLSHQAGLPNEFLPKKNSPTEPDFQYISDVGEKFDYSGEAYRFLLDVMKHITGKELEELARETFANIGMQHSSFKPPENVSSQAVGHKRDREVDKERHFYFPHPAASLYTTVEDYGLFMKACMENLFIREHLFEPIVPKLKERDQKAIDAQVPDETLDQIAWGLGIGLQKNREGTLTAFHWGDANGTCRNFMAINLNTNRAVACFTNSANGPAIYKALAEPIVGKLDAAFQWLNTREGYNQEKVQNLKNNLKEIKDVVGRDNISSHPFSK